MAFRLTDEEYRLVEVLPEEDLVQLAVELDIAVEEDMEVRTVLSRCVEALADLAGREGLPFSDYDREDLENLPVQWREALARRLAVAPDADAIVKQGRKVYKIYSKQRKKSQVPLVLPSLLLPLARHLAESA